MNLHYDKTRYELNFKYKTYIDRIEKKTKNILTILTEKRIITLAILKDLEKAELTYIGTSTCHPNDNFNKEEGRKLAIERLCKNLNPSFSKKIKETYYNRK
jgi:hypothetical protein